MKVWLDDVRPAPPGWRRTRTPQEAIDLLETGRCSVLSLDFDLGLEDSRGLDWNGEAVVKHIEERLFRGDEIRLPEIKLHTANVAGRRRMRQALDALVRRHPDRWKWVTTIDGEVLRPTR